MFNNQPHRFDTHQAWLYAEKVANGDCGLGFGFRSDIMYGIDSADTQAFGNNPARFDFINGWDRGATYGWAMPQLYVEAAWCDVSVKMGHFFTLVGYEVVTAPNNFFYSHSYTMFNSEPFTHTGVLFTDERCENLTLYYGWTAGWDTGFDPFRDSSIFIGGFSKNLSDCTKLTYIATAGNMGIRGDGYSHSIVLDTQLSDCLNYVVQSDLVSLRVPFAGAGHNDEVGLNQYLFYTVNDCFQLGTRLEW